MGLVDDVRAGVKLLAWVPVGDDKVCPDCDYRGGLPSRTLDEWDGFGVPGAGLTQCKGNEPDA